MKKAHRTILNAAAIAAAVLGPVQAQESNYIAQKLMLENDLRQRISSSLEKILDDHRYVLDLSVQLKFTPSQREEVTFRPKGSAPSGVAPVGGAKGQAAAPKPRSSGLPIPGFDFQLEGGEEREAPAEEAVTESPAPASSGEAEIVSQSRTDIVSSMPVVEKMEISCILPEASSPELIENVRQIIMVASHFDRSRGDVLSIMTASFKPRKDERTAEQIILKSIAEKVDQMEQKRASEKQVAPQVSVQEEVRKATAEFSQKMDEQHALYLAELKRLEDQQRQKEFESLRQSLVSPDAQRLAQVTSELEQLRSALASGALNQEEQKAAEASAVEKEGEKERIDKMISEKMAMLQSAHEEMKRTEGGMTNLPIYLMSAISLLAVVALAAVILFNGRRPKYVMPPPWMAPMPKKKVSSESPAAVSPVTAPAPPPAAPIPLEQDPAVAQAELKSARQSVVSMTVGQPETATTIVKEWLQQEAPPAPAPAAPPPAPPAEEEGKKKKKK